MWVLEMKTRGPRVHHDVRVRAHTFSVCFQRGHGGVFVHSRSTAGAPTGCWVQHMLPLGEPRDSGALREVVCRGAGDTRGTSVPRCLALVRLCCFLTRDPLPGVPANNFWSISQHSSSLTASQVNLYKEGSLKLQMVV